MSKKTVKKDVDLVDLLKDNGYKVVEGKDAVLAVIKKAGEKKVGKD